MVSRAIIVDIRRDGSIFLVKVEELLFSDDPILFGIRLPHEVVDVFLYGAPAGPLVPAVGHVLEHDGHLVSLEHSVLVEVVLVEDLVNFTTHALLIKATFVLLQLFDGYDLHDIGPPSLLLFLMTQTHLNRSIDK